MSDEGETTWMNPKRLRYCLTCDLYHGPNHPGYDNCPSWDAATMMLFHGNGENPEIRSWRRGTKEGLLRGCPCRLWVRGEFREF